MTGWLASYIRNAILVSDIALVGNDESSSTSMGNMAHRTNGEMETSPHLPTLSHAKEQQEGMELMENEAYTPTNVPVEPNQCYGTSNQLHVEEYYDYVQ